MVGGQDSDLRRLSRQIYSLLPLTAWVPPRKRAHCVPATQWCQGIFTMERKWCRQQESNSRPSHYKCAALPTELCRRGREY